jgi:hypothetical protein
VGLGGCISSRRQYLAKPGEQRPTFPIKISSDPNSVWNGDYVMAYLTNFNCQTQSLDKKVKAFPRGFKIDSREKMALQK